MQGPPRGAEVLEPPRASPGGQAPGQGVTPSCPVHAPAETAQAFQTQVPKGSGLRLPGPCSPLRTRGKPALGNGPLSSLSPLRLTHTADRMGPTPRVPDKVSQSQPDRPARTRLPEHPQAPWVSLPGGPLLNALKPLTPGTREPQKAKFPQLEQDRKMSDLSCRRPWPASMPSSP